MKKLLALLLAAVMVVSLAACAGTPEETTPSTDPATEPVTEPVEDTTEPSTEVTTRENKLIFGTTTDITGDWTGGIVTNGATDMMISSMINDYATLVTNQDGNYVENPTVLKSWERTDNEDGSATYTISINEGLTYNNGEPITIKDYVFKILLQCSSAAAGLNFTSATHTAVVGGADYRDDAVDVLSGLKIVDDYTMSLSIVPDYVQYYYADTYAAVGPWNIAYWIGEGYDVADDGEGAYFTKDGEKVTLAVEDIQDHFNAAKAAPSDVVSAGPYNLTKFDAATRQATLDINPNYAGNFEGQKPSIQTVVITKVEASTWADALKTGEINVYEGIADGTEVNTVLDMIDNGAELQTVQYDRAGYGKIQFFCDVTPTQFVEVRQAIAMLLDRASFADTFCAGWGSVVNGPYSPAMWQYNESKDVLADNLNTYPYDVDAANAKLDEGGWTLTETGDTWTQGSGLRYKEVTAEQAENMEECVTLSDGRILMPLIIKWCSSEENAVSDLLATMLANADAVKNSGMSIVQDVVDWDSLLNAIYRTDADGNAVAPFYSMTNLATNLTSTIYDFSFQWTDDPEMVSIGYNTCYLYDMDEGGLDQLSMDMVYAVEAGDDAAYLDLWQKYILRWNELLPELPLYSNILVTAIPTWVENYEENAYWDFAHAVLYASIPSAQ